MTLTEAFNDLLNNWQTLPEEYREKYPHKVNIRVYKKDLNEDKRPHCRWKFITLPNNFESVVSAQAFLIENFERLNKELDIVKKYSPKDWVGYIGK